MLIQINDLKFSKEIKAVLIILSGVFLFLLGYNFLNGTSLFKKENSLFALYDNVEGLQVGTKVTVNGLSVGKVAKIDFLPNTTQILVSFTIRNDVVFSKNSVAELYEAGLIGGKSIAIHPVYDNYTKFKSGDTLKSSVKPGLTDVVNQQIAPLQQKLEKVLTNADSLFSGVNNVLNSEGKNNLSTTLENLSSAVKNTDELVSRFNSISKNQNKNINRTIENLSMISESLNNISDSLSKSNLKQTIYNFEKLSSNFIDVLTEIQNGKGTINKLIYQDSLYQNLKNSSKAIEILIKDLKSNPKRYVHFSLFGKKEK
ncbi:MAG: ABC transporter substrate-binding protein [Flavobacteriaceae bacterium]|nr:ABC transporter substrate-binding protein [Flavobacteriaceae bacterium]